MNIAILDDDEAIQKQLKNLICKSPFYKNDFNIVSFFDAESLLENYEKNVLYDILFLDIEMEKTTGMQAAEKIRQSDKNAVIVFVSNYPCYIFDAFKVEALHFIVKPVKEEEFNGVFSRAIHKYTLLNSAVCLKWHSKRYVIKIDTIKYIEGRNKHIIVYTADGVYEVLGKISEIYKELYPHGFVRTHQSFVVNMNYIKRFETYDIVLTDDTKVMLSVRKRTEALRDFDNYIKNRKW